MSTWGLISTWRLGTHLVSGVHSRLVFSCGLMTTWVMVSTLDWVLTWKLEAGVHWGPSVHLKAGGCT